MEISKHFKVFYEKFNIFLETIKKMVYANLRCNLDGKYVQRKENTEIIRLKGEVRKWRRI